jgi:3-dehydroquinate dehydratase-2
MSRSVFILNGPNLNLLGTREPEIYGRDTLDDIAARCREAGGRLGLTVDFRQSNHEGEIVGWIQEARGTAAAVVLNAGAYTHTSVAILDALKAYEGLKVELHLSNPHRREAFRHLSYVAMAADAVIAGLGPLGYEIALEAVARKLG